MNKSFILLALAVFSFGSAAFSQSPQSVSKKGLPTEVKEDWQNLDFDEDKVYGTSTNKVFAELIQGQKPKKVMVVAVIDSGVEWEHADLAGSIWVNEDEVPGNGIDDDQNGYIDDVHGWNFLVNDKGEDVEHENLEATRILRMFNKIKEENGEYPDWMTDDVNKRATEIYNENVDMMKGLQGLAEFMNMADPIATQLTGKADYTFEEFLDAEGEGEQIERIRKAFKRLKLLGIEHKDLEEMVDLYNKMKDYYLNYDFEARTEASMQGNYGNNHYEGPDASHGTHVSGIIAANRDNEVGGRGIAHGSAVIMILRAVPDGDERDEDVAKAVYYAVDNGANIINMSFGKGLSPNKALVDAAFKYAEERGVLIVHAAGNDSENNDTVANYPSARYANGERAQNVITVGASSADKGKKLPASFSNYGSTEVDLFAPGAEIYSTMPDGEYEYQSGTSMAAPVVSGVAALLWSYYPDLTAAQIRDILINTSTDLDDKKVIRPGSKKEKVKFGTLSYTGGIVNTYAAFQAAAGRGN